MKVALIFILYFSILISPIVDGQKNKNKEHKAEVQEKKAEKQKYKNGDRDINIRNSGLVFDKNERKKEKELRKQTKEKSPNGNKNKYKVKKTHNQKKAPKAEQTFKWKPKPNKKHPPPPEGYSGWKPTEWVNSTEYIDDAQRVFNRTSQLKYEQYYNEVFGESEYVKNDLLTPEQLNGRELVPPGKYPHMAAVGVIRDNEDVIDWKCGGSLISRQFVLTAAHCCEFGGENPTHVELGAIDLRNKTVSQEGSVIKQIQEVVMHPYYAHEAYYYDIGLLKLLEEVVFSFQIRPAQLWPMEYMPYLYAFACGYGATAFGKRQTYVLTEMNLDLIGNEQCNKSMPTLEETPYGILDNQLCAMDLGGVVDTCQGDSGGPLQLNLPGRRRPRHSLVGIVSYGVFCGSSYPGVYTRIFSFLDWIESIVWPQTYSNYNPDFVFPKD